MPGQLRHPEKVAVGLYVHRPLGALHFLRSLGRVEGDDNLQIPPKAEDDDGGEKVK